MSILLSRAASVNEIENDIIHAPVRPKGIVEAFNNKTTGCRSKYRLGSLRTIPTSMILLVGFTRTEIRLLVDHNQAVGHDNKST